MIYGEFSEEQFDPYFGEKLIHKLFKTNKAKERDKAHAEMQEQQVIQSLHRTEQEAARHEQEVLRAEQEMLRLQAEQAKAQQAAADLQRAQAARVHTYVGIASCIVLTGAVLGGVYYLLQQEGAPTPTINPVVATALT